MNKGVLYFVLVISISCNSSKENIIILKDIKMNSIVSKDTMKIVEKNQTERKSILIDTIKNKRIYELKGNYKLVAYVSRGTI